MLVHINGYPGVGKLTIGRALVEQIGGKLLDNHAIYNVAFALTEFRTAEFYDTVRGVRDIAFQRVLDLPPAETVVLTNWYSQGSQWGEENWDAVIALARRRASTLAVVVLACSPEENERRTRSSERAAKRKPRDPALVENNRAGRPLIHRGGDKTLHLDVTNMSADAAASAIATWLHQ